LTPIWFLFPDIFNKNSSRALNAIYASRLCNCLLLKHFFIFLCTEILLVLYKLKQRLRSNSITYKNFITFDNLIWHWFECEKSYAYLHARLSFQMLTQKIHLMRWSVIFNTQIRLLIFFGNFFLAILSCVCELSRYKNKFFKTKSQMKDNECSL
jgi:hypothetical protein